MEEKAKVKTAKELKATKFLNEVLDTTTGKMSVKEMLKTFGLPVIIIEYAKIECKTLRTAKPVVVVERIVDIKMKFPNGQIITEVPKTIYLEFAHSGIETRFVRHPSYDPANIPKDTKAEIKKYI